MLAGASYDYFITRNAWTSRYYINNQTTWILSSPLLSSEAILRGQSAFQCRFLFLGANTLFRRRARNHTLVLRLPRNELYWKTFNAAWLASILPQPTVARLNLTRAAFVSPSNTTKRQLARPVIERRLKPAIKRRGYEHLWRGSAIVIADANASLTCWLDVTKFQ